MSNQDQELYLAVSYQLAEQLTKQYSTSFSRSIQLYSAESRKFIYAIYGMVRLADEIVDAGFSINPDAELTKFAQEIDLALKNEYASNPILHAFQDTVKHFSIDPKLIDAFIKSMRMDIEKKSYTREEYKEYIYGSAEVVGLMSLAVFVKGDESQYAALQKSACLLGSAFQKVNFLRDISADYSERGRSYFPGVDVAKFSDNQKKAIEKEIAEELSDCYEGISLLPPDAAKAVGLAHTYYSALLKKIARTSASNLLTKRVRLSAAEKLALSLKQFLPL